MANARTSLDIEIRTLADERGAKLTNEQLDRTISRVEQLQQRTESLSQTTTAEKQILRDRAAEWLRNNDAVEKGAKAAENAHRNVTKVKEAFGGLRDVVNGTLNGNLGQAGEGLLKIGKAATGASGQVAQFFAQVARGASAGAIIAGPVLVAIGMVRQHIKDLQKDMDRIYEESARAREALAAGIAANAAAVQKNLEAELKTIEAITAAYERRQKQIDQGRARDEKLRDPQRALRDVQLDNAEKAELAKTKDPLKQAKIKSTYDRRREQNKIRDTLSDFSSSDYAADDNIRAARDAINAAQEENRGAQNEVIQAQGDFERARAATRRFATTDNSAAAKAARNDAKLAQDRLDKVKGAADSVIGQNSKLIESAQSQIDAANLQKEETSLRRAAYLALTGQRAKEAATPADRKTIEDATAPFVDAPVVKPGSGGSITRNGQTVKVTSANTVEKLTEAGKALSHTLRAVEDFADKTTQTATRTAAKLNRAQQAGPGGGG